MRVWLEMMSRSSLILLRYDSLLQAARRDSGVSGKMNILDDIRWESM